jgi:hypothetical protein
LGIELALLIQEQKDVGMGQTPLKLNCVNTRHMFAEDIVVAQYL